VTTIGLLTLHLVAGTLWLGTVLDEPGFARAFVSEPLQRSLVEATSGTVEQTLNGISYQSSFPGCFVIVLIATVFSLVVLLLRSKSVNGSPASDRLFNVTSRFVRWSLPVIAWTGLWLVAVIMGNFSMLQLLALFVDVSFVLSCAGWLFVLLTPNIDRGETEAILKTEPLNPSRMPFTMTMFAMVFIAATFTAMNWRLYDNLLIPHGDSAMYEEHLWNLTHGKGFRSYLDQGLFLGEHIQVVHVLLVPIHLLWPSQKMMELCESLALASCAIPVWRMAFRHSQSRRPAMFLALATLLYVPLHYLDIAIDLKTFRPISFGVPAMLWAIDAMECRRWKTMVVCFALALSAKEDFAIVIAPLGLWLCVTSWFEHRRLANKKTKFVEPTERDAWNAMIIGGVTCLLATAYLLFVVKVAIPWFRDGETVHYARYFAKFGETPTEIVWTMFTEPWRVIREVVNAGNVKYFVVLLLPVGMPFKNGGWHRLMVAAPVFLLLCMNEISQVPPFGPFHHFHAPVVAIVLWAMCAASGTLKGETPVGEDSAEVAKSTTGHGEWVFACSLAMCFVFSFGPLSIRFWDYGTEMYWQKLYVQNDRAKHFEEIAGRIPIDARVASTDYVHTRLTHCERSYDYSDYPRKVANYEPKVPDDTDLIVLDTKHRYSAVRNLDQVRELQQHPERWRVVPNSSVGDYILLERVGTEHPFNQEK